MLSGGLRRFSVGRLVRFLVKLDRDVETVPRPHRDRRNVAALHVSWRTIFEAEREFVAGFKSSGSETCSGV
jgi:hypothetical protein